MKKLVLLPIDERPCNYRFPYLLALDSEYEVVRPPLEIMPHKKQAGDCARLLAFLEEQMATAKAVILSLNTLLYGGLVPSRVHTDSYETVAARLEPVLRAPAAVSAGEGVRLYADYALQSRQ